MLAVFHLLHTASSYERRLFLSYVIPTICCAIWILVTNYSMLKRYYLLLTPARRKVHSTQSISYSVLSTGRWDYFLPSIVTLSFVSLTVSTSLSKHVTHCASLLVSVSSRQLPHSVEYCCSEALSPTSCLPPSFQSEQPHDVVRGTSGSCIMQGCGVWHVCKTTETLTRNRA